MDRYAGGPRGSEDERDGALWRRRRDRLADLIERRGVRDAAVLAALRDVPRHLFVPPRLREMSYEDRPLPIGEGQVITQPYLVAEMVAVAGVEPGDAVLEIGTGSGYGAAILSRIAGTVFTVERRAALLETARGRFEDLGYENIRVRQGDGSLGWLEHAPYDAIIVTAGGPRVPEPLLDQLGVGGRLVIPVGSQPREQELFRITRTGEDEFETENLGGVYFVPLIGERGWGEEV